jgi:hypothetical protein
LHAEKIARRWSRISLMVAMIVINTTTTSIDYAASRPSECCFEE